jgi:nitrite reductase/ring-hydroxylating ferredoxin subunit
MSDAPRCAGLCGQGEPIGRRTFLSESVLAAAALALTACMSDISGPPTSVSSSLKIANYPALAVVNGIATVNLSGAKLAIVRTGASSFIALSLICPHQGGSISTNGTGFLCSRHGARFNGTGTWIGGERTSSMRSYPATYDAATDTLTIG